MSEQMTQGQWTAEVRRRIGIDEGCRLYKYRDSNGIVTFGIGFNLERGDAQHACEAIGADWITISAAPVAKDAQPENAVAPCITQPQANALFHYSFAPILSEAQESLRHFGALSDARRFVVCDMIYNLGFAGWMDFQETRSLIDEGAIALDPQTKKGYFEMVARHLEGSAWYSQVGNRAKRDVAMMRASVWCDPTGDGSDIGGG